MLNLWEMLENQEPRRWGDVPLGSGFFSFESRLVKLGLRGICLGGVAVGFEAWSVWPLRVLGGGGDEEIGLVTGDSRGDGCDEKVDRRWPGTLDLSAKPLAN